MIGTLTSVDEYLKGDYRPDVHYVEGRIEERNVGEKSHAKVQFQITTLLKALPNVYAFLETRLKVGPTRYRVPDVCAFLDREPDEEVFTLPPVLCIEILSPEDRMSRTIDVVLDYFHMGVSNVWVIDPLRQIAYVCDDSGGFQAAATGHVRTSDGRIMLLAHQIFDVA
jgi:Uma2 family endonuclease